jgi:hypothetical protein
MMAACNEASQGDPEMNRGDRFRSIRESILVDNPDDTGCQDRGSLVSSVTVGVMSQRFRLGKSCLGFALVALAVQAITPDPHDLTSCAIARIIQSLQSDALPPKGTTVPPGADLQDETADEVYAPLTAGPQVAMRRLTSQSTGLKSNATRHRGCATHPSDLRTSRRFGGSARTGELLSVLCRLTC